VVSFYPEMSYKIISILYVNSLGNWWQAALDAGISVASDPNSGSNTGVFFFPTLLDPVSGTRSYAKINHYDRVKNTRPNYHLLPDYTVGKVLINGTRAVGVEYLPSSGGSVLQVNASREVLLAAGGVHTPQILQLSGIGSKSQLETLGIQVISNLPGVGQNLQDHATLTISYNCKLSTFLFCGNRLLTTCSHEQRVAKSRNV
jgi:choline dehydrogenase